MLKRSRIDPKRKEAAVEAFRNRKQEHLLHTGCDGSLCLNCRINRVRADISRKIYKLRQEDSPELRAKLPSLISKLIRLEYQRKRRALLAEIQKEVSSEFGEINLAADRTTLRPQV